MRKGGQAEVEAKPERGAPPRGRRGQKAKTSSASSGTLCTNHKKTRGTDDMQQCTTSPQKRRRTQESLIREDGKADAVLCVKFWKRYKRTAHDPSIRKFAKLIGEAESTVRTILNKGTTAGRLTYWLPDQKKRGYFDLSPAFAAEETRRRASNKGPRGKISNRFMHDFAEAYATKKSVTYALKALRETPRAYHIPSRSAVYRLMARGELLDKNGKPLIHNHYRKKRPRGPTPADPPRNHAPKHLIDDLPPAARHHTKPGHFQMDTVHSPNGRNGLLTLIDPYHATPTEPRRFYLYFLPTLTQDAVTDALRRFRRDLRANDHELKTILTDNGPEFLHEDTLEALLRVPIYYCHPYCAWEKGSVERHNRLLRTYHPKPTDFSKLSPHTLRQTRHLIVHYPRSPRKAP